MQSELREAVYRICEDKELISAVGLNNHLAKACFVQGLTNERIQTIVRSKGETAVINLHRCRPRRGISSFIYQRRFSVQKGYGNIFKGPAQVSVQANDGVAAEGNKC
jgi:hypothetical protein